MSVLSIHRLIVHTVVQDDVARRAPFEIFEWKLRPLTRLPPTTKVQFLPPRQAILKVVCTIVMYNEVGLAADKTALNCGYVHTRPRGLEPWAVVIRCERYRGPYGSHARNEERALDAKS